MKIKKITLIKIMLLIAMVLIGIIIYSNYIQEKETISQGTQIAVEPKDSKIITVDGERVVEITQTVDRRSGATFYCTLNFYGEKCIKSVQNITTSEKVTNDETKEDWKNISMTISGNKTREYTFKITMASGLEVYASITPEELFPRDNNPPTVPVISVESDKGRLSTGANITITAMSTDEDEDIEYIWEGDRKEETAKYEKGEYKVRAKAIDIYGEESDWSEYTSFEVIGEVYAFRCSDDNSLRFYKNRDNVMDGNGTLWDITDAEYSEGSEVPWLNKNFQKVVFEEEIDPISTAYWFYDCDVTTIEKIYNLNTSTTTNMRYMFDGCSSLTQLDLSGFDTSNVTTMEGMFSGCIGLTLLDLSGFDTSNVTDMSYMFYGCIGLTQLDVSEFNTSNVTNMRFMFRECSGLTQLDVSGFDTSNVTDMYSVFDRCSSLTQLDVSGFDTSNVTTMRFMFRNCSGLTQLDLSGFDTSNVTIMTTMFSGCSSLTSLDLSEFDTSNVTNMACMFSGCSSLTSLDVSGFNTSNVTTMDRMFSGCSSLTSLDVSGFNTSNVTNMDSMFAGCSGITQLNLSSFSTAKVTSTSYMFSNCTNLRTIYVNSWSKSSLTESTSMFYNCTKIRGGNGTTYNASYINATYARIDTTSAKGYFTKKS